MASSSISAEVALILILRLCLSFFFFPGAIGKLLRYRSFVQGVVDYQMLPRRIAYTFGFILPWIELAVAFLLIAGIAVQFAATLSFVLLICFTTAVIVNLRRDRRIECNCYGVADTKIISWGTVARNSLLLVITITIIFLDSQTTGLESWPTRWQTEWSIFSTSEAIVLIPLLVTFCCLCVYLTEWAVDIQARVGRLRSTITT